jgi:hypothetical protein
MRSRPIKVGSSQPGTAGLRVQIAGDCITMHKLNFTTISFPSINTKVGGKSPRAKLHVLYGTPRAITYSFGLLDIYLRWRSGAGCLVLAGTRTGNSWLTKLADVSDAPLA